MKKIIILFDHTNEKCLSYIEVLGHIEIGTPAIFTNCLDFFNFSTLDRGYDVEVKKSNGEYISLSELIIDVDQVYSKRKIIKSHDTRKMLISNEFKFKAKSKKTFRENSHINS